MIARAHPCLGAAFPLFLISEMPHLIKKLRNVLWASWLSGNKRNLGRPNDPALNSTMLYAHAHLGMLEEAWIAIEGEMCALGGQLASLRNFRFMPILQPPYRCTPSHHIIHSSAGLSAHRKSSMCALFELRRLRSS
mmetsp:Transcript_11933/g.28214  ORF Transcript_11933/g.28214 Transcript_11933/m.28214 type:complete len:136 (+) Transcript_11933:1301-1708(+)